MKLKAAFRYQAVELVQSAAVFCLIVGAIIVAFYVMNITQVAYISVPNLGFLPYVLMPLLVLSTLPGDVRFLMQMGLTRTQMIASTAASFGAACLFLAAVEAVCSLALPFWPVTQSLFLMTYGAGNGPVLDFLFMFLGCAAAAGAALAFAALQMRFGTRCVVLAAAAAAIVAIGVLSSVEGAAWAFSGAVSWLFGLAPGAGLANPFLLFAAVAALGVAVAWASVRRIEVR